MPEILLIVILLLVYIGVFGVCIAQYVMQSMAMHSIADKRGVKNAWLAWIPVGESWVAGKVVDEYDERTGTKKNWAKTLLILSLAGGGFFVVTYIAFFVFVIVATVSQGGELETLPIVPFVVLYVLLLVAALLMCAWSMLRMICTYKVYESIVPEKAIKYMIVSVIVPLGIGVCMLKAKKVLCAQVNAARVEEYKHMLKEQLGQ
ncbi:MAG: hypothetical protein IJ435_00550 [Clostridia bacterium]|nr:hypothetical protein [Clostridia bacterium]